jgi:hypothetical protein
MFGFKNSTRPSAAYRQALLARWAMVFLPASSIAACGAADLYDGELSPDEVSALEADDALDPTAEDDGPVLGRLGQALVTPFDVGVIPSNRSCPNGADPIRIRFDDEDDNNGNSRGGYIGSIISNSNTDFLYCREDGRSLFPLTTASDEREDHYAVLKLGTTCPNGSNTFSRRFDNEDDNNGNSTTGTVGSIAPNVVDDNANLVFCLFRGGSQTMGAFPQNFPGANHFGYGVFAQDTFTRGLATGFIRTDDEDDNNGNSYSASAAIFEDARLIVSDGANTVMDIAEVVP